MAPRVVCYIFSLALLGAVAAVRGAGVDWLYEVEVPVADQSQAQRADGTRRALLQMLTRMTGLENVPLNPTVTAALDDPGPYYVQYRFQEQTGADGRELDLLVSFDPTAITRLVNDAGLPIWSANRPVVVVWIVVEGGPDRELLGAGSKHPVLDGLRGQARARGINLVVPLMDLEDQLTVSPAAVYGSLSQVLMEGAARYGGENLLIGRVAERTTGGWRTEWEFWMRDSERELVLESDDGAHAGSAAADLVADELVVRYAVQRGELGVLKFRVADVNALNDYAALLEYLNSLEFVDSIRITQVEPGTVLLDLTTPTSWSRFAELLVLDRRLVPLRGFGADERHQLSWRGAAGDS